MITTVAAAGALLDSPESALADLCPWVAKWWAANGEVFLKAARE